MKRVVIVGASGMVGGHALRYALDHPAVGGVTAIGRKPAGVTHPKLNEVLHQDFADCSALAGTLADQDAYDQREGFRITHISTDLNIRNGVAM